MDVLRGLTIAFMILVNNPGCVPTFTQLSHSAWNGFTLCDWVFPSFMFVMGVSMAFSMRRPEFRLSWKILRRALILFAVGLALNIIAQAATGLGLNPAEYRIPGVLQRLGVCFGLGAVLIAWLRKDKWLWIAAGVLLAAYSAVLLTGNGYSQGPDSILAKVDSAVLGDRHLYGNHAPDPEGILSTVPSVAHTLIGFLAGGILLQGDSRKLAFTGLILLAGGLLLSILLPLNKSVWSPSYVLFTCGASTLLLAALHWLIDERKVLKHNGFFRCFGTNAIWCYVLAELITLICIATGLTESAMDFLGRTRWTSLLWAVLNVLLVWLLTLPLFRKGKYIRI